MAITPNKKATGTGSGPASTGAPNLHHTAPDVKTPSAAPGPSGLDSQFQQFDADTQNAIQSSGDQAMQSPENQQRMENMRGASQAAYYQQVKPGGQIHRQYEQQIARAQAKVDD